MEYHWECFDNGKSIGEKGSESGTIIRDEEHTAGARVTLERDGGIAPFSITLGIYGMLFHTQFLSNEIKGNEIFDMDKELIEKIIDHYDIDEHARNDNWHERYEELI